MIDLKELNNEEAVKIEGGGFVEAVENAWRRFKDYVNSLGGRY